LKKTQKKSEMMAIDTSSLVEFLKGSQGGDIEVIEDALDKNILILPPIVLSEIISDPKLSLDIKKTLQKIPSLPIEDGFWYRAGILRSKVIEKKRKARLGDALIAQYCIDHSLTLITRYVDFKSFLLFGKLKISLF